MIELIEENRGYDRKSINRHSWREMHFIKNNKWYFIFMDKTTDTIPCTYQIYQIRGGTGRLDLLQGISENSYFADGLSWKNAIKIAEEYLDGIF